MSQAGCDQSHRSCKRVLLNETRAGLEGRISDGSGSARLSFDGSAYHVLAGVFLMPVPAVMRLFRDGKDVEVRTEGDHLYAEGADGTVHASVRLPPSHEGGNHEAPLSHYSPALPAGD